jgi:8-oxo-dGTP pyrophosphatase MutT (NUDIX family)
VTVVRRQSVRIAVVDGNDRLLMLRTRDPARPDELWWELPGGGVEPEEAPAEAAKRELREETGIEVDELDRRIGVVETEFDFDGERYRQQETVFLVRVTGSVDYVPTGLVGSVERAAHLGHRWWPHGEELPRVRVHPPQLRQLLRDVW